MFEKVNPMHPDKIADRIAGALVDMAYKIDDNPKIAVEVLIGHGKCHIIAETSVKLDVGEIKSAVLRIAKVDDIELDYEEFQQDEMLANNQKEEVRCGDNGIFKGVPVSPEQTTLTNIAHLIYDRWPTDGKYVIETYGDFSKLVICQSKAAAEDLHEIFGGASINPLGDWEGGINVDSGATNRKLGSDMGDSVTGGGLHGKDLSKADVSVNIYVWLMAQNEQKPMELSCAIGDSEIGGRPFSEIVSIAKQYIDNVGGFEKLAEWGLIS